MRILFSSWGLAGLLLASTTACAQESSGHEDWITEPVPQGRTVFADFIGVPGRVAVRCMAMTDGRLTDCTATATPQGIGYERVVLESVRTARMRPYRENGRALALVVNFNIDFPLPEPWPDYSGPEPSEEMVAQIRADLTASMRRAARTGCIIADVAPDRQMVVQAWVDELVTCDGQAAEETLARRMGRVILSRQAEGLTGEALRRPPSFEELNSADSPTPEMEAAADELRRRYCAAYDCTVPEGMEPEVP
jgi:hypothetical protein